jgi:type IV pilus assembly protein PilC
MATFRYTAKSAYGDDTAGVIDAPSLNDALEDLLRRGLREVQVTQLPAAADPPPAAMAGAQCVSGPEEMKPGSPFADPPVSLAGEDASELAVQVAQVSAAKVPLAAGLRAAAEETASRRVALALLWIAEQLDRGRTLEDTLGHSGRLLPTHVSGLILAAARTGRLGEALFELVEQQQSLYALRRRVRQGFSYALLVLSFAIPIVVFLIGYVSVQFRVIFSDFGLRLPTMTAALFWVHDYGLPSIAIACVAALMLALLLRLLLGRVRWQQLTSSLPLVGPLWRALGVAEWSGLMSVLLRHEIPLPNALRLAGHGVRNAYVGEVSLRLADGVARGRLLSQLMYSHPELPSTLIPLVAWGERAGTLSESFQVGRTMCEKRVGARGVLLQSIVLPLLFAGIVGVVWFVIVALFAPLINLISMLS